MTVPEQRASLTSNNDGKASHACQGEWAIQQRAIDIPSCEIVDVRRFEQPFELRVLTPRRDTNPDREEPPGE